MIYRNTLLGTLNFNGTQITGFIQDWVNTGPLIKIDRNPVRVDSSCPTAISSLDEPVCGEEKCLFDNDPNYMPCVPSILLMMMLLAVLRDVSFRMDKQLQ